MFEKEVNDREQTQQALRPAQAAPVRRTDGVTLAQAAAAHNPCAGVDASSEVFNWQVPDPDAPIDAPIADPIAEGEYYVVLPDGRRQRVAYSVEGDSGFQAEPTYQYPVE